MKATLEFNLPEENSEYAMYQNAGKYHSVLWDLKTYLRNKLKYEEPTETSEKVYTEIRDKLFELLNEQGISDEF